jgi:hypothetical protein
MPTRLDENAPVLRYQPGVSTRSVTLSVPRGKTVTVFAVEFNTNGFSAYQPPMAVPTRAPAPWVEFVSWTGAVATPDQGVAVIVADADKTITANFDRVESLLLRRGGCSVLKAQITGPGLLGFGTTVPDPPPDLTSLNAFTAAGFLQPERDYILIWGKQGSTVTVRSWPEREDRARGFSGFIRWDGSAAPCGTNFNCQVPIPARGNSVAPMRFISGYVNNNGLDGCNCPPNSPLPCTHLP